MIVQMYSYSDNLVDQAVYKVIKSWSEDTFPEPHLLPEMGVVVCDDDGTPIVFLCADTSSTVPRAFIDHLQTNPSVSVHRRYKATLLADKFLCDKLKEQGFEMVYSLSGVSQVSSLSRTLGYEIQAEAINFFQKTL